MKTYTVEEMKAILAEHAKWLRGEEGERANLRSANLSSANLSSADLRSADLSSADLRSADLSSANLRYADLRSADLRSAKPDEKTIWPHFQICSGGLIVWKKVQGRLVTLLNPDSYDDNPMVECSHGIHFFQTRKEAEEF